MNGITREEERQGEVPGLDTGLLDHDDSKRSPASMGQWPIDMAVSHKPDTGLDPRYRRRPPRPFCSFPPPPPSALFSRRRCCCRRR